MQKQSQKKEVELRLKEAEIKKVEAEARRIEAEALKAGYEANKARLEFEKSDSLRKKELSLDEENCVYRFYGYIFEDTVRSCINRLTEWSRMYPKRDIEIIFSSGGGSIIHGFELFDFIQDLKSKGHKITTGSLGMAASMAGVLLQAGDVRWIGHQSWMMIHRAAFGAIGKTFEIEDEVKFIKRIESRILDIFTQRSGLTKAKIQKNWDRKDWWINADECKDLQLVDEIRGIMTVAEEKK